MWKKFASSIDANGNTLTDAQGRSFTWDFENRLVQVVVTGTNGGTTTFKYAPLGRRIQKSGPSGTTNFLYDGINTMEEIDNSGNVLAKYTHGAEVDEDLAILGPGTTSYYHQDGLGSVTSLTDSTGAIANTYTYDSFGKVTASTGTIKNSFQYTGREFDSETGIYYYRARYFDPSIGRFLSEDSVRFGAGPHFYVYVQNNPLNLIDPRGHKTCWNLTMSGRFTQELCPDEPCTPTSSVTCVEVPMPTGPLPPDPPAPPWVNDLIIVNQMSRCERLYTEELLLISMENSNDYWHFTSLFLPKAVSFNFLEGWLEGLGAHLLANAVPIADGGDIVNDVRDEVKWNDEFKQRMKDALQRECDCENAASKLNR